MVSFLRSSSLGAYEWCGHRYWIEYVLGKKPEAGQKAQKGNMFHKAVELLAAGRLAQQKGEHSFTDAELGVTFPVGVSPEEAVAAGYSHYADPGRSSHAWSERDRLDVQKWLANVLAWQGGQFDPRRREILAPELYFDLEVEEPWAEYSYDLPQGNLSGRLRLKGTLDLVTALPDGGVEYVDWKTGRRYDWVKEKEKTPLSLRDDLQFRLYHYALSRLFSGAKYIAVTVFYVTDGGPYTVQLYPEDLPMTSSLLRAKFETIRSDNFPRMLAPNWKCEKLCRHWQEQFPGEDQSVCAHLRSELVQLGITKATLKHADLALLNEYGSGGGRGN